MTVQERLANALVGTYRVERELGAGGMATVYLAHDLCVQGVRVLERSPCAFKGSESLNGVLEGASRLPTTAPRR
jgi:hypothetical protein